MKRLAAVAVLTKSVATVAIVVAWFALSAGAQRGGGHGGFSGSHGFSGPHGGFASHSAPAYHGGFSGPSSGRMAGPPRNGMSRSPYINRGFGQSTFAGRTSYADPMHRRMPYRSPYGRNNRYGFYGWGGLPLWSGYPYLPGYMGDFGDYDAQDNQNYAGSQPYPDYSSGPYDVAPGQEDPNSAPAYTPWPYGSQAPQAIAAPAAEEPITLVFKDRRPSEQIRNYILTGTTLTVLDEHRRDIPIDQIDLSATARVNHDAGIDFSLPGGSR